MKKFDDDHQSYVLVRTTITVTTPNGQLVLLIGAHDPNRWLV